MYLVVLCPHVNSRWILYANTSQGIWPSHDQYQQPHTNSKHDIAEYFVDPWRRVGVTLNVQVRYLRLQNMSILLKYLPVPSGVAGQGISIKT